MRKDREFIGVGCFFESNCGGISMNFDWNDNHGDYQGDWVIVWFLLISTSYHIKGVRWSLWIVIDIE